MALPKDFLSKPPPNDIVVNRIDFVKEGFPEYANHYAVVLDSVLSLAECRVLLKAAEATTDGNWERAMVNVGGGQQRLLEDIRSCGRIIWDSQDVVDRIWNRISNIPEVQEIATLTNKPLICGNGPTKRKETWKLTRPNERMRFLKYVGGEYFKPHCDGTYETPDGTERSYLTLHLYLNDANEATGGATAFHSLRVNFDDMDKERLVNVEPRCGRILLFQHRNLVHSGTDVEAGTKYTMRTDMMYRLESTMSNTRSPMAKLNG